jgi:hypothetical protein
MSLKISPVNPALCLRKWQHVVVNLQQRTSSMCCKTPRQALSPSEIEILGTDVFTNNKYQRERRSEMLSGLRHPDCNMCWKVEDQGMKSVRINVRDEAEIRAHSGGDLLSNPRPTMLDIELSNLCDAKCIYCNAFFSSRWVQDQMESDPNFLPPKAISKSEANEFERTFWKWFDSANASLNYIAIIGGEPLINKKYYDVLNNLNNRIVEPINSDMSPRIVLVTISNMNTPDIFMDRFLDILPELTSKYRVNFDASMDAYGRKGEFIREGVDWERWSRNVERILSSRPKNLEMGFQIAINALTPTSLLPLLKKIKSYRDDFEIPCIIKPSIVTYPDHLSPYILTSEFSEHFYEASDFLRENHDSQYDGKFLNFHESNWNGYAEFLRGIGDSIAKGNPKRASQKKFEEWVNESEKKRNLNFLDIFPEYKFFLEHCRKA